MHHQRLRPRLLPHKRDAPAHVWPPWAHAMPLAQEPLAACWAERQDAAFIRAIQVTEGNLQGTSVTSVITAALKVHKAKFQQISSISPDGDISYKCLTRTGKGHATP